MQFYRMEISGFVCILLGSLEIKFIVSYKMDNFKFVIQGIENLFDSKFGNPLQSDNSNDIDLMN